jgi:hypothetical protein
MIDRAPQWRLPQLSPRASLAPVTLPLMPLSLAVHDPQHESTATSANAITDWHESALVDANHQV